MFANILFFGRENCKYSLRISNFLKNSKKLIFIKVRKEMN